MRKAFLTWLWLALLSSACFIAAPRTPQAEAAPSPRLLDEIYRLDMDMRGMWPHLSPLRGNFPDAQEWAAEKAGAEVAAWRARCRKAGMEGQVAVLAHSGGTLAADRMLQAGMRIRTLVLWSPGMRPEHLARDLKRLHIGGKQVLAVSGPLDMPRYQLLWHSQAYTTSPLAGKAYQVLEVRDRQHKHNTMLALGEQRGKVRGTLPGLTRRRDTAAAPNGLARRFLLSALDPKRPALFLVIGGTDTAYEPGTAAAMMERLAKQVVHARAHRWVPVTIPKTQRQEQAAGKWRPDGRVRLPAGARAPAAEG